nr:hypothetical protein [Tanacetum cinerariifolium]
MLIPDAMEHLEPVEEVTSLERGNVRLQGTVMMESERADRFWRRMSFMESDLRQIRRFRYYDMMRFRKLDTFVARRLEAIIELVNRRVQEALDAYKATRAANALEVESQSQNSSDGDNGNGGNRMVEIKMVKMEMMEMEMMEMEMEI